MDTAPGPTVTEVGEADILDLAPSLLAYARFYGEDPDPDDLVAMASAFVATGAGTQLLARDGAGEVVGHATVLWSWDTTLGLPLAVMEDLFVRPDARSLGVGRALLVACRALAADRGCRWLQWQTAPDNTVAQRLYDSMGGDRSPWLTYRIPTGPSSS
ncbi:GNAT family N-acetyltransferase [Pedococcus ginsenosidimutans]|uniref:GNAT family N-acetyltransferase n=1 Tax=Pedococcus ginsenosidimutans TaxID=490570 RepID=A0ABP8XM24_9MICO